MKNPFIYIVIIFLLAVLGNCRDASDIVISKNHFTEAKITLDPDAWKTISPHLDSEPLRSKSSYGNFYPDISRISDSKLVLRSEGFWTENRGWVLFAVLALFFFLVKAGVADLDKENTNVFFYWGQVLLLIVFLGIPFFLLTIPIVEAMNPIRSVTLSAENQRLSWNRVYYGGGDFPADYISYVKEGKEEVQIVTIANEYITLLRSNDEAHRRTYALTLASSLNLPLVHPSPTPNEWRDWFRISLARGADWKLETLHFRWEDWKNVETSAKLPTPKDWRASKNWRLVVPAWETETNPLSIGRWLLKILFYGVLILLVVMFFGQAMVGGLLLGGIYGGIILVVKTIFRNRKYPEDAREEYLEICLKSKLFWTFCILWIVNMSVLGYSLAMNLNYNFSYDAKLLEFNRTEVISKIHKTEDFVKKQSEGKPKDSVEKTRLEDLDWKEYLFYVFFRTPWEQWEKLIDLTKVDWQPPGNRFSHSTYDRIGCNHWEAFYSDNAIRCDFFRRDRSSEAKVQQIAGTEVDPFHWEIVARILDGR